MNILLYIPIMWPCEPKFRSEIIYNHWEKKDKITILKCRGELKNCCAAIDLLAPKGSATGCSKCMQAFFSFMDEYGIPYSVVEFLSFAKHNKDVVFPEFESVASLDQYSYRGADIGAATLNTLANCLFDCEPDLVVHKKLLTDFLTAGVQLFDHFDKISPQFDRIYFWGGRTILERPAERACEKNSVEYVSHEYGYAENTYMESIQATVHSIDYWKAIIVSEWSENNNYKKNIAEEFFKEKREGHGQYVFTALQKKKQLPACFEPNKHNIALFDSSIIETLGLKMFSSKTPPKDFGYVVFLIARLLADKKHIKLYLRCHPNILPIYTSTHNPYIFETQQKMLRVLSAIGMDNLHVIFPHEFVDTYALVDHCATTLTCGSTIGAEATFWGKASVLLGRTWYEDLDVSYIPETLADILALIEQIDLPAKPRANTLPYAFHLSSHGQPFCMPHGWQWEEQNHSPLTGSLNMSLLRAFYRVQGKLQKWCSFLEVPDVKEGCGQEKLQHQIEAAEKFYSETPTSSEINKFYCEVRRCASILGLEENVVNKLVR